SENRCRDCGTGGDPSQGYLGAGDPTGRRDPGHGVHDVPVTFLVQGLAEVVCRATEAGAAPVPGQSAAGQRTPWGDSDALVLAESQHFAFFLAVEQVVVVLHRGQAGP